MSESEKPLGRACLVTLLVVAMMSWRPDGESIREAYGSSRDHGAHAATAAAKPTRVDPEKPTTILSQFRIRAYDRLPDADNFRAQAESSKAGLVKAKTVLTVAVKPVVDEHNSRNPVGDTADRAAEALAQFRVLRLARTRPPAEKPYPDFLLTAYAVTPADTGKEPDSPSFGITYSGTRAKVGRTVAVDPKVIPIGSVLWIEGLGLRVAEDTGGAVKGHHIDVLVPDDHTAIEFGVKRHVHVYRVR